MKSQFREKTYEKYFFAELSRITNSLFPPDQWLEHFWGFDDAVYVPPWWRFRFLPHIRARRHYRKDGVFLDEINRKLKTEFEYFPKAKFNLFIQYKIPDFLSNARAKEWPDWNKPYFRIQTTPHQQVVLEKIDGLSAGRAATVYAAPAFWKFDDLCGFALGENIIDQSNIVNVARLHGHSRYTYSDPGNFGYAHSEPEHIESEPFRDIIGQALEKEGLSFVQNLKNLAVLIEESVSIAQAATVDDLRAQRTARDSFGYFQNVTGASSMPAGTVLHALATIEAFADAFGVSPYVIS